VFVAKVEAEDLFADIAIQVNRLDCDVCPIQTTLEARPEVFDSVGVNVVADIPFDMVDNVMDVGSRDKRIGGMLIGDDVSTRFDVAV
jgi:hypothetical protein